MINPYMAALEQAADTVARQCGQELGVKANALRWKLTAIPAAQDALMQPDPGAALLDGWAFAIQTQDYFGRGPGREELGSCHGIAVDAGQHLEGAMRHQVELLVPDKVPAAEQALREWASSHPLEGLMLPRTSTADLLASRSARRSLGALATVGAAVETLDDITARMTFYRESLLKEARWTVELTAIDAASGEIPARILQQLDRLSLAVDRLGELSSMIPRLVERERAATMAEIDRQRVDTLGAFRVAGQAALGSAQDVTRGAIDHAADRAERLVDRAFRRGTELALAAALVLLIVVVGTTWILGFRIQIRGPRRA